MVSIIIPVLDSHEILRRQFLHFEKMGRMDDVEIIVVDDGSNPALSYSGSLPVTIYPTNDYRPWTWALARNKGARIAKGEYLLMFDVDHIITKEALDAVRNCKTDKMSFRRELGVLLEDGTFTQHSCVLLQYGVPYERLKKKGVTMTPLPNNFAMRKDVFWKLGGYREDLVEKAYPQGEDRCFKKAWLNYERNGGVLDKVRPTIYMFPNGKVCNDVDYNPFGLFHKLSRKTSRNYWYKKQRETAWQ